MKPHLAPIAAFATGTLWMVAVALGGETASPAAGEPKPAMATSLGNLPANQWIKIETKGSVPAFDYARMVWVPGREQLLQYNLDGGAPRAFDAARAGWVPDAPAAGGTSPAAMIAERHKALGGDYRWPIKGGKFQQVMNTAVWDSKRGRVVYAPYRLTFAYDPAKRDWEDLKAKAVIDGKEYAGGLPVFGAGACYDPINDEIVMFPHWVMGNDERYGRIEPKNYDRRDVDGRISSHLGTLRFGFADNTWKRVSDTFGSAEVKKARRTVLDILGRTSRALDDVYVLRRRPDAAKSAEATKALETAATDIGKAGLPAEAQALLGRAVASLKTAGGETAAGKMTEALAAGAEALRVMDQILDEPLRVEPPPRCAAPMVYDPGLKAIVLFGGRDGRTRTDLKPPHHMGERPGALNDTWLYDCATRQWRELKCNARPPVQDRPYFFRDPASGLFVLVTFDHGSRRGAPARTALYTLDAARGAWSLRAEQEFPVALTACNHCTGSHDWRFEVGLDERRGLLVFSQKGKTASDICVLRLNLGQLPPRPLPDWKPEPPIVPHTIPPDDPVWVAKLKSLAPNTWVPTGQGTASRAWGNLGCDAVRGHVYYFGGGHSTYQGTDVAVYAVGANKWCYAAGEHNDFIPPVSWDGVGLGFRGGDHAHHQRNAYQAVDGRMFVENDGEYMHFYDLDRGGVWRQLKFARVDRPKKAPLDVPPHMSTPDGRLIGLHGRIKTSSTPPQIKDRALVSIYDVHSRDLRIAEQPGASPGYVYESRPFCFLPDRDQVFFLHGRTVWLYDLKANAWRQPQPKGALPAKFAVHLAEYIEGQDAVWCVLLNPNVGKRTEYWVYSLKRNAWTCMAEKGASVGGPYGQAAYVAKYGVIVAAPGRTRVMRPDFSLMNWE